MYNPEDRILETVWKAVVDGLETATTTVGRSILKVYRDGIIGPVGDAGASVLTAAAATGDAMLAVEHELNRVFIEIGMSSGLAAPVTVVVLFTFGLMFSTAAFAGFRSVLGVIYPR